MRNICLIIFELLLVVNVMSCNDVGYEKERKKVYVEFKDYPDSIKEEVVQDNIKKLEKSRRSLMKIIKRIDSYGSSEEKYSFFKENGKNVASKYKYIKTQLNKKGDLTDLYDAGYFLEGVEQMVRYYAIAKALKNRRCPMPSLSELNVINESRKEEISWANDTAYLDDAEIYYAFFSSLSMLKMSVDSALFYDKIKNDRFLLLEWNYKIADSLMINTINMCEEKNIREKELLIKWGSGFNSITDCCVNIIVQRYKECLIENEEADSTCIAYFYNKYAKENLNCFFKYYQKNIRKEINNHEILYEMLKEIFK